MWKVKDDVDIEEVEKYGYDDFGVCYKKYGVLGEQYFINKGTREITRLHPYSFREKPDEDELYDLIQAGLVEKVEEER